MSEGKRAARLAAAVERAEAEAITRWPDNGNRNYDSKMKARRFAFVAGALWYRADGAAQGGVAGGELAADRSD